MECKLILHPTWCFLSILRVMSTVNLPLGVLEVVATDITCVNGNDTSTAKNQNYRVPVYHRKMLRIGRSKQLCDFTINHLMVSLLHCLIWAVRFDSHTPSLVYIRDVALNGTFVNSQLLGRGNTHLLENLDTIEIKPFGRFIWKRLDVDMEACRSLFSHIARVLNWTLTDNIVGSGSYGKVYVCRHSSLGKDFAVKVIRNYSDILTPEMRERVINESELLAKINHPNIVKVYDTLTQGSHLYIIEDLVCGGDLFSYIFDDHSFKPIPESEAIFIIYQLLQALDYLHNQLQVIHRDIKLDNVLLDLPAPYSKVFLCDFGTAKHMAVVKRTHSIVGTAEYSAPEVINPSSSDSEGYNNKCDMWALGVMLHIMLSGISPFLRDGETFPLSREDLSLESPDFPNISKLAKNFIKRLLVVDLEQRMSVTDCLDHVWIVGNRKQLVLKYSKLLSDGETPIWRKK